MWCVDSDAAKENEETTRQQNRALLVMRQLDGDIHINNLCQNNI